MWEKCEYKESKAGQTIRNRCEQMEYKKCEQMEYKENHIKIPGNLDTTTPTARSDRILNEEQV